MAILDRNVSKLQVDVSISSIKIVPSARVSRNRALIRDDLPAPM